MDCPNPLFVKPAAISYVSVPLLETMPTPPGWNMCAGIIPSLHSPGVIMPGVFGPIIVAFACLAYVMMLTASFIGMCSVIITMIFIPFSKASRAASAANGAGTKIIDAFTECFSNASATVSYTGTAWTCVPPFPGVTPATIFVP